MTGTKSHLRFGVIGIDHRHVYHLVQGLLDAGAACAGYVRHGSDPKVQEVYFGSGKTFERGAHA